jgi:hypothetical protein
MKKILFFVCIVLFLGFFVFIEPALAERFVNNNDNTVTDTQTGLMWGKDNRENINWQGAKSYCGNYRGGGYTDWRMPTLDELAGLYDAAKTYKSACGYNAHLTELPGLSCAWAWASDISGQTAAYFDFYYGKQLWYPQRYDNNIRALPVRSGK